LEGDNMATLPDSLVDDRIFATWNVDQEFRRPMQDLADAYRDWRAGDAAFRAAFLITLITWLENAYINPRLVEDVAQGIARRDA
jgi:hypothetical protein